MKLKRLLAVLPVAIMTMGCLTACGAGDSNKPAATDIEAEGMEA